MKGMAAQTLLADLTPEARDIDLGGGHWLSPFSANGALAGYFHIHPKSDEPTIACFGSVYLPGKNNGMGEWDLLQAGPITLSPSLACSCGDHGFVREGKWVPA